MVKYPHPSTTLPLAPDATDHARYDASPPASGRNGALCQATQALGDDQGDGKEGKHEGRGGAECARSGYVVNVHG